MALCAVRFSPLFFNLGVEARRLIGILSPSTTFTEQKICIDHMFYNELEKQSTDPILHKDTHYEIKLLTDLNLIKAEKASTTYSVMSFDPFFPLIANINS